MTCKLWAKLLALTMESNSFGLYWLSRESALFSLDCKVREDRAVFMYRLFSSRFCLQSLSTGRSPSDSIGPMISENHFGDNFPDQIVFDGVRFDATTPHLYAHRSNRLLGTRWRFPFQLSRSFVRTSNCSKRLLSLWWTAKLYTVYNLWKATRQSVQRQVIGELEGFRWLSRISIGIAIISDNLSKMITKNDHRNLFRKF